MKSRGLEKASDDDELFHQAVEDVRRLNHNLAASKRVRTTSSPLPSGKTETAAEFGEELRYIRPGIQTASLQKLRRGQFPIEATLDLHGVTAAEATVRLQHFIQESQMARRGAVRIVHGKGYGSAGRQPVLKTRVHRLLQQFPAVLAFCSARARDGGTGAVDVLLRKSKTRI